MTPPYASQIELEYPMSLWAGFISVPFKDLIRINKRGLPHNQVKIKIIIIINKNNNNNTGNNNNNNNKINKSNSNTLCHCGQGLLVFLLKILFELIKGVYHIIRLNSKK